MTSPIYNILSIVQSPFLDHCVKVSDNFLKQKELKEGSHGMLALTQLYELKSDAEREKLELKSHVLGGAGTNLLKVLAELDPKNNKCALFGMVGNDAEILIAKLRKHNITTLMKRTNEVETGVCVSLITKSDRTMRTFLGSAGELKPNYLTPNIFTREVGHVHLEGYLFCVGKDGEFKDGEFVEKSIDLTRQHAAHDATISLDLGASGIVLGKRESFLKCCQKVDFIFGNKDEFLALTGKLDLKDAVESLGIGQTVVATNGDKGCYVKEKGSSDAQHFNAKIVPSEEIVDLTGAGDFFAAGFIHGKRNGMSTEKCVEIANLIATYVIRQLGTDLSPHEWTNLQNEVKGIITKSKLGRSPQKAILKKEVDGTTTSSKLRRSPPKAVSADSGLATRNRSAENLTLKATPENNITATPENNVNDDGN